MSELADRTLSTRSAITRTVDRLVAREWVRRVRSADDQRGFYAELTELGQRCSPRSRLATSLPSGTT